MNDLEHERIHGMMHALLPVLNTEHVNIGATAMLELLVSNFIHRGMDFKTAVEVLSETWLNYEKVMKS